MSKSPVSEPVVEVRRLDALVPYWRNPRTISNEAVNAVAESIRQFGYQQFIVVDDDNVIIIGHTRYMALRRLGYHEVPVMIERNLSPQQVKQLRVLDNRTSEYTSWDFERLMQELTDIDSELMQRFFPEVAPQVPTDEAARTVEITNDPAPVTAEKAGDGLAEFICPTCFHSWEMRVTPEMVQKGRLTAR